MKDEITGKLIKPSNGQTLHYLLTEEYWDWQKEKFKQYIGKNVKITIAEIEEGE